MNGTRVDAHKNIDMINSMSHIIWLHKLSITVTFYCTITVELPGSVCELMPITITSTLFGLERKTNGKFSHIWTLQTLLQFLDLYKLPHNEV